MVNGSWLFFKTDKCCNWIWIVDLCEVLIAKEIYVLQSRLNSLVHYTHCFIEGMKNPWALGLSSLPLVRLSAPCAFVTCQPHPVPFLHSISFPSLVFSFFLALLMPDLLLCSWHAILLLHEAYLPPLVHLALMQSFFVASLKICAQEPDGLLRSGPLGRRGWDQGKFGPLPSLRRLFAGSFRHSQLPLLEGSLLLQQPLSSFLQGLLLNRP